MAYMVDLSTARLFMKNAIGVDAAGPRARFLIISAHGCQAPGRPAINPNGRTFIFYGPHGKVITTPPVSEIIKREAWAIAFETYTQAPVEDYWIYKYAGSQNKLDVTYGSFGADLDLEDTHGEYHIFSVRRLFKGWFGQGKMLLSEAVALAERWNKGQYQEVFCCFCRGVPGQPLKGSQYEHTYLDNRQVIQR